MGCNEGRAIGLLIFLTLALAAQGASVTLAWDASESTNVAGYRIYFGGASGSYTNAVDAGTNLTLTISNLAAGATYYCAATAYDPDGAESDFSNEVSWSGQPAIVLHFGRRFRGLSLMHGQ